MILNVFYVLSVSSIVIMFYALYRVISLNKQIPGGAVKKQWQFLTALIVLFSAGYLTTPFFNMLPDIFQLLIVGVIFLFGAIFVVIVVNLFHKVITDLGF